MIAHSCVWDYHRVHVQSLPTAATLGCVNMTRRTVRPNVKDFKFWT